MSNNLGQIYAKSKDGEKYIILDSQNVEVSGNFLINGNNLISGNNSNFSSTEHTENTSVVETENRTDVELKIPTKPSSFIKAIDSTIKSFPTYLSDFAQPESVSNNSGYFGWFVSVSDDGHTILVSDYRASGDSLTDNGALWCFEYSGGSWSQKGSTIYGPVDNGRLGEDLHLSGDGNTIYAGSNRNELTALYIYTYNTSTSDWNTAVTISGTWRGQIRSNYDGTIFIASEPGYSVPSYQVGRALIYEYSGGSWSQKGSEIVGQESSSLLHGVAMSPDGTKIAISERSKGRYKVFTYDPSTSDWVQKGSTLRDFDDLDDARAIDISDDGNTLAVGAYGDDTNGLTNNGSIKIYTYDTDWTLVKTISGDQSSDLITYAAISLSGDGTAVGFSERYGNSSNLARIRVFRLVNSVWTEIYTDTINYDGAFTAITCKMSRDKSTIISHYRDTDNSNYRTIYLAHSYNNGYNYYANTDTTTPDSYKSIRLMPSTDPKSGYLELITDENENFEMKVRGDATLDTLTVNGASTFTGELVASTATLDTLTVNATSTFTGALVASTATLDTLTVNDASFGSLDICGNLNLAQGVGSDENNSIRLIIKQTSDGSAKQPGNAIKIIQDSSTKYWMIGLDNNSPPRLSFRYNGGGNGGWLGSASNVDMITFTGQHLCIINKKIDILYIGLIVSANNNFINLNNSINPSINESLPICNLSNMDNDKKVFGVISNEEHESSIRKYSSGNFVSTFSKTNANEQRLYINSLGEGAIWVCNKNGPLENGDYITSSSVTGYGMKQNDDLLHNYTVAKITCDCDFDLTKIVKQKVNTFIDASNEQNLVYDSNGDIELVNDLDASGNMQMVYKYDTRFLDSSGNSVEEGLQDYIACFVGCTYHCG